MRKLDTPDEHDLSGIFYRAWVKEITDRRPHQKSTRKELERWMAAAERKILAALKRVRSKQMKDFAK